MHFLQSILINTPIQYVRSKPVRPALAVLFRLETLTYIDVSAP